MGPWLTTIRLHAAWCVYACSCDSPADCSPVCLSAGTCVAWQHVMEHKRLNTQDPTVIIVVAQVESEARNPYTALKRRYATLQRNALHVQNALVRSCAQAH